MHSVRQWWGAAAAVPAASSSAWVSAVYVLAGVALLICVGVLVARRRRRVGTGEPPTGPQMVSSTDPAGVPVSRASEAIGQADEPLPPAWLRPALLQVLQTGRADDLAVIATIVDLAVRGFLRIEAESPTQRGLFGSGWRLVATGIHPDDPLAPYELLLLTHLFDQRRSVELGQLSGRFAAQAAAVKDQLVADGARNGWLVPKQRSLFGSRTARTPDGDRALSAAEPYCARLTAGDVGEVPAERAAEVFSRSLSYALVLDRVELLAREFDRMPGVRGSLGAIEWFAGAVPSFRGMNARMSEFVAVMTGALASAPASVGTRGGSAGVGDGSGGHGSG